jgi:hypothetical protein
MVNFWLVSESSAAVVRGYGLEGFLPRMRCGALLRLDGRGGRPHVDIG